MDYIEGISFKTYIANHGGKVSVEEALNVMIPVLRALTAVHAGGLHPPGRDAGQHLHHQGRAW